MIDLAPCPFCGEKLVQHDDHHGTWWAHKNEVGSCWASVEQIHDNDDAKRWNKRHAQCAPTPQRDPELSIPVWAIKEALKCLRHINKHEQLTPIGLVNLFQSYVDIASEADSDVTPTRPPMLADLAQIIDAGWKAGKSSVEVAGEILREFDGTAVTSTECGGAK